MQPPPWQYTSVLDAIDHWQTLIAGIIALVSAIIAIIATVILDRHKLKHDRKQRLLKEIRIVNTASMLTYGITNTSINAKRQLIKPIKTLYDAEKTGIIETLKNKDTKSKEIIFRADFRTIPCIDLPLKILQTLIFENISVDKRPIALLTSLDQSGRALNTSIEKRNNLIEIFKKDDMPDNKRMAFYFGFQFDDGNVNEEYPNLLDAIALQIDDVLFFSVQLGKELSTYGETLLALYKKSFREDVPRIVKADFSQAQSAGLMPDDTNYSTWFSMFAKAG